MKPDDDADDRAWRSIVENYGDRAELDDPPPSPPPPPSASGSDAPFGGRFGDPRAFHADEPAARSVEPEEEGFVPPEPPPLPVVAPDRGLAWLGVLGSPLVLLAALIFGIAIPTWLGYLLVMGFVGGFLYLVLKMPREPRDPWDDGAQV
ncbi:hypothetical protein [Nocardioides pyridinolyticus]